MNPFALAAQYGVIPVINVPGEEFAQPLAEALTQGGLPLIEVTLRNEHSLGALKRIKQSMPEMTVGAGTVLSISQVDQALEAGADFIVAPGMNPKVVEYCLKKDVPVLPGCVTATEIEAGMSLGLNLFKFFPSEQLGGIKTMKELSGPYRNVQFIATSGISLQNLPDYMSCPSVAAVGGSFMAPSSLGEVKDWDGIIQRCRQVVRASHGFHIVHVGLNGANAQEGEERAKRFAEIFDLPYRPGGKSDFAGTMLESGKTKFPGEKGHIAVGTYSVERGAAYLQAKNVTLRDDWSKTDLQGRMVSVYLEEEIGGFAIHLLRSSEVK